MAPLVAKINPTIEQPEVPSHAAYVETQLFATREDAMVWLRQEQVRAGARADAATLTDVARALLVTSEAYGRALTEVKAMSDDAMLAEPVDLRALVGKHSEAVTAERLPRPAEFTADPETDEEA